MMPITLDGERVEVPDGSTLRNIIPGWDTSCCVAIISPGARESARTESVRLTTTAGEVMVELNEQGRQLFDASAFPLPLGLHWHDRYSAAFGPFPASLTPARTPHLYERGDLVLGCGGYDPKRSYLIIARSRHTADLGAAAAGGIIGRVMSGRGVLDRWATGDSIIAIAPVMSWADTSRSFTTTDPGLLVEEGMEIITRVRIAAQGYSHDRITTTAAGAVEHMLLALENARFKVTRAASTHIRDERRLEEGVTPAETLPRREGSVTVRTRGRSGGAIYIYIQDLPALSAHTTVGQVTHGLEIPRLAKEGDTFCINVDPPRFDLIGMPLGTALAKAQERSIAARVDQEGPGRIVVDQAPGTTLECLAAGTITITTVPLEKVIDITLDDRNAPLSCDIFRRLTGLHLHDVGRMPFYFNFEDVYLFKPKVPKGVPIIPENTPEDLVPAGALAITNDSRKGSGLVGVRTVEHGEFGPTSEPFEGTNLIGRVLDLGKLTSLKENEIVFIREVRS